MTGFRIALVLSAAALSAGCRDLEAQGYQLRAFEGRPYETVYKTCVEAVQVHGGNLAVTDIRNGRIQTNWSRYPPVGPGENRPIGSDKYRMRTEAVVERSGVGGARVFVRVLIEREEHERRTALAGLAPSDILHDSDRAGPSTPLQEQAFAEGGFGSRWTFYRTDTRGAETILRDVEAALRKPAESPAPPEKPGPSTPK